MIDHLLFYQLKPEVGEAGIKEMIRSTRSFLLRIPLIPSVRFGPTIDPKSKWPFYVLLEFESLEKMGAPRRPRLARIHEGHGGPNVASSYNLDYETNPSKDLKYS